MEIESKALGFGKVMAAGMGFTDAAAMRSMTGYGHGEHSDGTGRVRAEIRSVNRRQAEFNVHAPREFEVIETRIREQLARGVSRGRVDLTISYEPASATMAAPLNRALAAAYARELAVLANDLGLATPTLDQLLRLPGVIRTAEPPAEDSSMLWNLLEPALRSAVISLNQMRDREGAHLGADLAGRVQNLRSGVGRVSTQAPSIVRHYREQLLQRIREAGIEGLSLEDERLQREVVLFADRSDISEELSRLESHFVQFDDCAKSNEPVGRKLDFLAQEMGREVNTLGAKANDATISADVVFLKVELERFREQAQNVE